MMLCLMQYKLDVHYVPGMKLYIADTLSPAYIRHDGQPLSDSLDEEMELHIYRLVAHLPISETRITQIKEAIEKDRVSQKLHDTIGRGWPKYCRDTRPSIHLYWHIHDELHTVDGLIFRSDWIVIPTSLCPGIMDKI